MKNTVVVLNDELGGMAYAFQRAGFRVLYDAVPDKESVEIVKKNLDDGSEIQICEWSEQSYLEMPEASVLAVRISPSVYLGRKKNISVSDFTYNKVFSQYIEKNTPELFFIVAPRSFVGSPMMWKLEEWSISHGYKINAKCMKTAKVTGLPVREERWYMLGSREGKTEGFLDNMEEKDSISWNAILEETSEEAFRRVEEIKDLDYQGDGIYEWRIKGYPQYAYHKSENVLISLRYPLVVKNGKTRYFSNREIARLKGYPDEFDFSNVSKTRVKKGLCCSVNVNACHILARQISQFLGEIDDIVVSSKLEQQELEIQSILNQQKNEKPVENISEKSRINVYHSLSEGDEMERRFDVFVSSTYEDLIEERKEITQAVLECDCMPVGMEMFPASNMEQWEFIKKVIDKADIYLVVVAGKYGTIGTDENGKKMSYTEMEFNYALSSGKPILAFLHKDINCLTRNKIETEPEKAEALEAFRTNVKKGRMVRFFSNKDELKANVLTSINSIKKQITTGGWVRANQAAFDGKKELENRVRELEDNYEKLLQEKNNIQEERKKMQLQLAKEQENCRTMREKENALENRYAEALLKVADFSEKIEAIKDELGEISQEMMEL